MYHSDHITVYNSFPILKAVYVFYHLLVRFSRVSCWTNSEEPPFDVLANGGEGANHFFELGVPLLSGCQRAAAAPQQPEVELRPKQVRYERVLRLVGASERQGKSLVGIDFVVGNLRFGSMEFGEGRLSLLQIFSRTWTLVIFNLSTRVNWVFRLEPQIWTI